MDGYDDLYRASAATGGPPWDIGSPQPALAKLVETVSGPLVLDAGCGTGDLALALARRGLIVTAFDISPVALDIAAAKAAQDGLSVTFVVRDAVELPGGLGRFDTVFDSGLLHSLDANEQIRYVSGLAAVCRPGADVNVLGISLDAGQGWGLTADGLALTFSGPLWMDTAIEMAEVAAQVGDRRLSLPGYRVTTRRNGL